MGSLVVGVDGASRAICVALTGLPLDCFALRGERLTVLGNCTGSAFFWPRWFAIPAFAGLSRDLSTTPGDGLGVAEGCVEPATSLLCSILAMRGLRRSGRVAGSAGSADCSAGP